MKLDELKTKRDDLSALLNMSGLPEETARIKEELEDLNRQIRALEDKKGSQYEEHEPLTEETLKPVNKVRSKLDKELQEWEVESTKDGQDSQGNG